MRLLPVYHLWALRQPALFFEARGRGEGFKFAAFAGKFAGMKSAHILDGKALAEGLLSSIAAKVEELKGKAGRVPGLAVILAGEDQASQVYVGNKTRAAKKCGFEVFDFKFPAGVSFEEIKAAILKCNSDARIDGILVQLPLPAGIDSESVLCLLHPAKDVDGLHPLNQGLLFRGRPGVRPCTPLGVLALLDLAFAPKDPDAGCGFLPPCDLSGKRAVVIGRSLLVGKPLSLMLLERNATVVMAHSKTSDLPAVCRQADVLIAAAGVPELVKKEWIKPGAVVIDVGINRLGPGERAGKLAGDVDFAGASQAAAAITPVPGGVGPLTVAMLMHNTLNAWLRQAGKK